MAFTTLRKETVLAGCEQYAQTFPSQALNTALDAVYIALDEGEQVTPAMLQSVQSEIAAQHAALDRLAAVFTQQEGNGNAEA